MIAADLKVTGEEVTYVTGKEYFYYTCNERQYSKACAHGRDLFSSIAYSSFSVNTNLP